MLRQDGLGSIHQLMAARDSKEELLAWIRWRTNALFPRTFLLALVRVNAASRAARGRRRGGRRGRRAAHPFCTEAFLTRVARLRDDEALRRWVQDEGKRVDSMRVLLLLWELESDVRAMRASDPEYLAIHNRLALNPTTLNACRICLERLSDEAQKFSGRR